MYCNGRYLIYVKNVTYTEIVDRKDVLINSGENYLYLNKFYYWDITNNYIDYLYDTYIKQNATTDDKNVFYLNSDNKLCRCARSEWY